MLQEVWFQMKTPVCYIYMLALDKGLFEKKVKVFDESAETMLLWHKLKKYNDICPDKVSKSSERHRLGEWLLYDKHVKDPVKW